MKKPKPEYKVVIDDKGCPTCHYDRSWMVVNSDGIGGGTSYLDLDDAEELCADMNAAFERGKKSK